MNYNLLDNPPPATPEQKRYRKRRSYSMVAWLRGAVPLYNPKAALVHGWRHDGPGRPLYGWHLQYATGRCRFLGRTASEALRNEALQWDPEDRLRGRT